MPQAEPVRLLLDVLAERCDDRGRERHSVERRDRCEIPTKFVVELKSESRLSSYRHPYGVLRAARS